MTGMFPIAAAGEAHPVAAWLCGALPIVVALTGWLQARSRRPSPPPAGHITVHHLQTRLPGPDDDAPRTVPMPRAGEPREASATPGSAPNVHPGTAQHVPRCRPYALRALHRTPAHDSEAAPTTLAPDPARHATPPDVRDRLLADEAATMPLWPPGDPDTPHTSAPRRTDQETR